MFKKLNLKTKMLLSICSVTFFAFAVTIAFVAVKASNMAKTEAIDKAEQIAYRYSGVVKAELEVAMDAARTTAQLFEGIKKSVAAPERRNLNGMLKQLLDRNPDFIGVWTCWEPNALDGKDMEFAGKEGHDSTGRFIPYWNRGAGKTVVEPLVDYDQPGAGDYYLLSKRTGKEAILDPYSYSIGGKEMLITSLVAPIKHNGTVVGVAGIDIALTAFEELVSGIKPFETGNAALIANNGTYVVHPDTERAGKDIGKSKVWANAKTAAKAGKFFSANDYSVKLETNVERVLVPIIIGLSETPWSFLVNIPMDKVMKGARSIMYATILIGTISLFVLMAVVFLIAKNIADPMTRIVGGLKDGAEQVASASEQISSSSESLAEGSSEQAASIEETSSSLEEMSSMTKQNAENAQQADSLMKEANQIVGKANDSMIGLTTSMEEISKASDETSKIIKTIDEIAFQTNLLALNAAVEAARAGEAGAGFAVVADEVRNLALRAADAAKNTAELIDGTVKKIKTGSGIVADTNEAFRKVAESSSKVGKLVGEIAAASNEQALGIGQVNTAVTEMDKVVQQNAANAEESASASEEMNAQAEQMKGMVGELMALVAGQGKGAQSSASAGSVHAPRAVPGKAVSAKMATTRAVTVHKGNEVSPDQIISLDDDFKNF